MKKGGNFMKFLKNLLLSFVFAGFMALGTTSANAACKVHLGDRSEERRVGKECRSRWSPYH